MDDSCGGASDRIYRLHISETSSTPAVDFIITEDEVEEQEQKQEQEEEEEEEEEEEVENDLTVLVGFVQKPEWSWSLSRQYFPSKAGGTPAWLDPVDLPEGDDILCGICRKPLQFLLQVYAPIEGNDAAFHRTLFVFMCPSMACLRRDKQNHHLIDSENKTPRSVKVFRSQLSRVNDYYSKEPPRKERITPITNGAPLCSWCGTWEGKKVCGGCKKVRYCSRQHQLEHWKSSHAAICKDQGNADISTKTSFSDSEVPASRKLWPEFEIVDEEEGSEEESNSGGTALIGSGKEDEISRQFQAVEPSLEQKYWADFQSRLSRAPDQVLRYCRSHDAKPLWPRLDERPKDGSIPLCNECNGHRIFEFQILPQLLYYFRISNDPDDLDWSTIVIYSCEASCESSKAYVEEFAWVQSA